MGNFRARKTPLSLLVVVVGVVVLNAVAALPSLTPGVYGIPETSQSSFDVLTVGGNGRRSRPAATYSSNDPERTAEVAQDHGPYGGPATNSAITAPRSVALDPLTGDLFISESDFSNWLPRSSFDGQANAESKFLDQEHFPGASSRVLRVEGTGTIHKVVGSDNTLGPTLDSGSPPNQSRTSAIYSLAFDSAGGLYVVTFDFIYRLERATQSLTGNESDRATHVVGNIGAVTSQDGQPARSVPLYHPRGLAFDHTGALFFAQESNKAGQGGGAGDGIRKVLPGGGLDGDGVVDGDADELLFTVAGGVSAGYTTDEVPARSASMKHPNSIAFDSRGNMFVSDRDNNLIRRVVPGANGTIDGAADEIISTVVGNATDRTRGYEGDDGPATAARLNLPRDIAFDPAGNLYIADGDNNRIRKVVPGSDGLINGSPDDKIFTLAGDGTTPGPAAQPMCGDPSFGSCSSSDMKLNIPFGVAVGPCPPGALRTDLYVSEQNTHRVRKLVGAASCAWVDLSVVDFLADQVRGTVGKPIELTLAVKNKGGQGANGVEIKVSNDAPLLASFGSASMDREGTCESPVGTQIICRPAAPLQAGEQVTVQFSATPIAPGDLLATASVTNATPVEGEALRGDNTKSLIPIPIDLAALPVLPCLVACNADGAPSSPEGPPPPPGSTPPGTTSIDSSQSSLSLAPPGSTGSASPSSAPAPGPASQPFGQKVPLTGSLGFQSGPANAFAPAASASPVQELVGAGPVLSSASALADLSDEQGSAPAPRYSMVSKKTVLEASVNMTTLALLAGVACFVLGAPSGARAAPGWALGSSRSRSNLKPAL